MSSSAWVAVQSVVSAWCTQRRDRALRAVCRRIDSGTATPCDAAAVREAAVDLMQRSGEQRRRAVLVDMVEREIRRLGIGR